MSIGTTMLGRRHVQPSVVASLSALMVEGTFPSGTYLVTVHNPIATDDGDLEKALYGSFLPIPSKDMFPLPEASVYESTAQPGAIIAVKGEAGTIKLNEGRKRIKLKVKSMGDRPIQVRELRSLYMDATNRPRLAHTITLSKRIHNSNSTACEHMATDLIYRLGRRFDLSLVTPRPSHWCKLQAIRSSRVEISSQLATSKTSPWQ